MRRILGSLGLLTVVFWDQNGVKIYEFGEKIIANRTFDDYYNSFGCKN